MVLAANVDLNCANNAYPWCKSASELGGSSGLVARFYNIGLGLVGFTAFGAIIFGAIKYTLSQGNPAKMQDALAWIWGAVWGIILLLGGWLLLNTINPEIVRLESPDLKEVKLEKVYSTSEANPYVVSTTTASGETINLLNYNPICKRYEDKSSCESQSKCLWTLSEAEKINQNAGKPASEINGTCGAK